MILFSSLINFAFGDRINSTFPFCLVFSLRSLFPRFHRFCVLIFNFINFWHEKCQSYRDLNLQTISIDPHIQSYQFWKMKICQSDFVLLTYQFCVWGSYQLDFSVLSCVFSLRSLFPRFHRFCVLIF